MFEKEWLTEIVYIKRGLSLVLSWSIWDSLRLFELVCFIGSVDGDLHDYAHTSGEQTNRLFFVVAVAKNFTSPWNWCTIQRFEFFVRWGSKIKKQLLKIRKNFLIISNFGVLSPFGSFFFFGPIKHDIWFIELRVKRLSVHSQDLELNTQSSRFMKHGKIKKKLLKLSFFS